VKMPTSRSYHSYLVESLKDPQEAAAYLDAVLEDGSFAEIRSALAQIAEAQMQVADDTTIGSHSRAIYETLSQPTQLDSAALITILNDLGFRISVAPKVKAA
jgi:DNA-binding phage protein